MNKKLILQLVVIFVIVQALGLYVANWLISNDISAKFISENPQDVTNSLFIFAYILIFTGILLMLLKIAKGNVLYYILKTLEGIAIFSAAVIVFSAFYDSIIVLAPAFALVIARVIFAKNILLRNCTSAIATIGVGALIGVSLGIMPVLIFLILLSIYDFIAVFKTKHMVTLAKALSSKNLSFTYALPTKEHTFELGTGDLVIPLTFAASMLKAYSQKYIFPINFIPSVLVLSASLLALLWTLNYSSKHVGKPLPALPPQAIAMIITLAILTIFGI